MADPMDESWSGHAPTAANLDGTTFGSGTTAERTAITSWPAGRPFYDTDLSQWFYNSHVSAPSSVTWSLLPSESSEQTLDLTNAESTSNSTANRWKGKTQTLGSAGKLYKVTDIEFKTSGTASGNAKVGIIDTDTMELVAQSHQFTVTTNTTYKTAIESKMLRGGNEYFFCVIHDSSAQIKGENDSTGKYISETYAENAAIHDSTRSITTGDAVQYSITVYYREY